MADSLLPCPFCGPRTEEGERVVLLECREGDFVRGYTARCDTCGIETHGEYESEVAAQWNKRRPMAPASIEAISAGAAAYELLIGAEDGEHDPEDVARTVIGAWVAASALPVPTIGDLNGTSPPPPAPEAAPADSLIATAKQLAWAHWTYWNRVPAGITDVDDLWPALSRYEREGYLAAARVVSGGTASDPYAGVLERDLLELTKAIFDAPTMAAGYAILADWAWQCGRGVPVALREAQPLPLTRIPDDEVNAAGRALAAAAGQELLCDPTSYADGTRGYLVASHARGMLAKLAQAGWVLRREDAQPQPDAALVEALREARSFVSDTAQAAKSGWGSAPDEEALLAKIDATLRAHQEASDASEQATVLAEFNALKEDAQSGQTEGYQA